MADSYDEVILEIRDDLRELRERVDGTLEDDRVKSLILTKLDEARLWLGEA